MKKLPTRSLFVALILLLAQSVNATPFAWTTTIQATDGSVVHEQQILESTEFDCEIARINVVSTLTSLGYTILAAPNCAQTPPDLDRLKFLKELELLQKLVVLEREWPPFPPGPVCLSCPYLTVENVQLIFPVDQKKVLGLMEKYQIKAYNEALINLQHKFNLQDFEQEISELGLQR